MTVINSKTISLSKVINNNKVVISIPGLTPPQLINKRVKYQ